MNVIYICNRVEIGGATKAILSFIKNAKGIGLTPIVITPKKNGRVIKFCEKNNIECHYIKFYEIAYSFNTSKIKRIIKFMLLPYFKLCNAIINNISLKKLNKKVDLNNIDIVHTNVGRDDFGILISKKYNIKHVFHLREYGVDDYNCKYLRKDIYKYFNNYTNQFIAVSNSIKNFYILKGIDSNKINVIYDGINNDKIIRKDYIEDSNSKKISIVILSGISENKGQIQVIKALALIEKEIRDNIDLYLYGNGNMEYINTLKEFIMSNELQKQVHFMGYCDDVYEKLNKYDIAITPSKSEAFGLVTIEYMFAGLPVIVSNTGANPEIIKDNESGLIFEYNNIENLKEKILYLYNNESVRLKLSKNAFLEANKRFTIDINTKNIKSLYSGGN